MKYNKKLDLVIELILKWITIISLIAGLFFNGFQLGYLKESIEQTKSYSEYPVFRDKTEELGEFYNLKVNEEEYQVPKLYFF